MHVTRWNSGHQVPSPQHQEPGQSWQCTKGTTPVLYKAEEFVTMLSKQLQLAAFYALKI